MVGSVCPVARRPGGAYREPGPAPDGGGYSGHHELQHVVVGLHVVEREPFEVFRLDLADVLAVLFREDDLPDPRAFRGEDLLLDAAYGSTRPRSVVSPVIAM